MREQFMSPAYWHIHKLSNREMGNNNINNPDMTRICRLTELITQPLIMAKTSSFIFNFFDF